MRLRRRWRVSGVSNKTAASSTNGLRRLFQGNTGRVDDVSQSESSDSNMAERKRKIALYGFPLGSETRGFG